LGFSRAGRSIPACRNGSAGRVLHSRLTASVGQGLFAYFIIKDKVREVSCSSLIFGKIALVMLFRRIVTPEKSNIHFDLGDPLHKTGVW